jgi:hypothetical protein
LELGDPRGGGGDNEGSCTVQSINRLSAVQSLYHPHAAHLFVVEERFPDKENTVRKRTHLSGADQKDSPGYMDYGCTRASPLYPTSCIVPTLLSNLMNHLRLPMLRSNPSRMMLRPSKGGFLRCRSSGSSAARGATRRSTARLKQFPSLSSRHRGHLIACSLGPPHMSRRPL